MEQIYYTQCPVGYGLGVSNGFQIKRRTDGYPLSGDFRHLGLRAFPAGGRALAPPALRYRLVDDRAEVAWLTPRPMEYETERGLWGRPGGHFAHGLILTSEEVNALGGWIAGLYDRPFWRRSDPEPSRGRPPDSVEINGNELIARPDFLSVAQLADGLAPELLARLLTALVNVAREGRTLFLIDEPARLGPRIALLTYLIPPTLRALLTFSTYHDRPEELPGYRIHGATPVVRPNRSLWLTQGIVVDLIAGTVEPRLEPSEWARELARWVEAGSASDWLEFSHRWAAAEGATGYSPWDNAWLDRLVQFGRAVQCKPESVDWRAEFELAEWAARSNLAPEWAEARGPDWWQAVDSEPVEGRRALLTLSAWPAFWASDRDRAWGQVFARWFEGAADIDASAATFAKGAPSNAKRFGFVQSLRRSVPDGIWAGIHRRLDAVFASSPKMVALWSVPEAVAASLTGRHEPIRTLSARFDTLNEPAETLFEAARAEVGDQPESIDRLAEGLIDRFDRSESLRWALRSGPLALHWLRPHLRRRFALPDDREEWQSLLDATPATLRPMLASVVLAVTVDPTLPVEGFRWAVENILLPLDEAERPADPSWAGSYLDRCRSDLQLIQALFVKSSRTPGLRSWLEGARNRGEFSLEHLKRISHLKMLGRALDLRQAVPLDAIDLGRIPGSDRGEVLARLLRRDANAGADSGSTLERCGAAWTASLRPGSPDLIEIARAIAGSDLLAEIKDAESWFHRLDLVRDRLDPATAIDRGLGPDGLVAHVVALRTPKEGADRATWSLREYLVNHESAWPTIAEDLRAELLDEQAEWSPAVVERWDRAISKRRPDRFWEVVLNVSDGRRLAAIISDRAADLSTLGPIAWWDHQTHTDAVDDIRDAYARLASFAPIAEEALNSVQNWMDRPRAGETAVRGVRGWLSAQGLARWICLDRLTKDIFRSGLTDQTRRFSILNWCGQLPLSTLTLDDRYRLIAWVVFKLEDPSALDVARVGHWLVHSGLTDPARLNAWPNALAGLVEVPPSLIRERKELVDELRREMSRVIADRGS